VVTILVDFLVNSAAGPVPAEDLARKASFQQGRRAGSCQGQVKIAYCSDRYSK
jgi:hypothetical protein